MTKAELLAAALGRGLMAALLESDDGKKPSKKDGQPAVVAVNDLKAVVQEVLPGLLEAMAQEAPPSREELDEMEDRSREQRNPGFGYDPNLPGETGWASPPDRRESE